MTPRRALGRYLPNCFEHFFAGSRFSEVSRTTQPFSCAARFRVVMGSNKDDGRPLAYCREPLSEFDAGHATELDVEHEAGKLRMLPVREKRFRRIVSNRLHSRRLQQPGE